MLHLSSKPFRHLLRTKHIGKKTVTNNIYFVVILVWSLSAFITILSPSDFVSVIRAAQLENKTLYLTMSDIDFVRILIQSRYIESHS